MRARPRGAGVSARPAALAIDLRPLRDSPGYRRLWGANVFAFLGTQMTVVAAGVQVYGLTGSSLAVGLLSLASLVPLLVLGLLAGAVADAVDRRLLGLLTSGGLALTSALLWLQASQGGSLPAIYALVAVQAGLTAFDSPTRRLFVPKLVSYEQLPAANALFQLEANVGHIAGPLVAGLLIATAGLEWTYALHAVALLGSLYAIGRLPRMRPDGDATPVGLRSIGEGLRFLRGERVLHASFLADVAATTFAMPRALFPELAVDHFGRGEGFAGVLHAAPAVGALLGAVTSGWLSRVRRQGAVVLAAVAAWGCVIAVFGLVASAPLALALLACAGFADMVSATLRATILLDVVPDALRGRLTSAYFVVVSGSPRLGNVQAGAVAGLVGLSAAVVAGGVVCLGAVGLLARWRPELARYERAPAAARALG